MTANLRREDGFTLPELLITMAIALIVSAAALSLVDFTMKRTDEVDQRVDASQRGRLVMDTITRELRSQVCVDSSTPAMATRAGDITDGNTATFYADLTDTTKLSLQPPDLHSLVYDTVARRITDRDYAGSWTTQTTGSGATAVTKQVAVYPATPTKSRVLLMNVVPVTAGAPIFRYYKYDSNDPPAPSIELVPPAGGLLAADLATVARVDIAYKTLPTRTLPTVSDTRTALTLQDQVYVREADPNDPAPTPTCA